MGYSGNCFWRGDDLVGALGSSGRLGLIQLCFEGDAYLLTTGLDGGVDPLGWGAKEEVGDGHSRLAEKMRVVRGNIFERVRLKWAILG